MSRNYTSSQMADPWEARTAVSSQNNRRQSHTPSSRYSHTTASRNPTSGHEMTEENMKEQARRLREADRRNTALAVRPKRGPSMRTPSRLSISTIPTQCLPSTLAPSRSSFHQSTPKQSHHTPSTNRSSQQIPSRPSQPPAARPLYMGDKLLEKGYSLYGTTPTRKVYTKSSTVKVEGGILEVDEAYAVSRRKEHR